MGAWGTGLFDNDGAMDWIGEFLAGEDDALLYETLDAALEDPGAELGGAADAEGVLAAAEVVASLLGRPARAAPGELRAWAREAAKGVELDPELPDLAQRAVRRVRDASELRELWAEGADEKTWLAGVDDLLARLAAKR